MTQTPPGLESSLLLSPALKRGANIDRLSGAGIVKLISQRLAHKVSFVTDSEAGAKLACPLRLRSGQALRDASLALLIPALRSKLSSYKWSHQ